MSREKFRSLIEKLKGRILAGEFEAGGSFPSEGMVARYEGMSRFTVHKAFLELRRMGLVAGGTGERPRVLRLGGSRKIGLLVSGLGYSEFFQPVVHELLGIAQAEGYIVLLGDVSALPHEEMTSAARHFAQRLVKERVSGVIYQPFEFFADSKGRNHAVLDILDKAEIPVILLGYDIVQAPERSSYDIVGINNFEAGSRLARHLLEQGARSVHFAMSPLSRWEPSCVSRLQGVVSAVRTVGFDEFLQRNVLIDSFSRPEALRRHMNRYSPDAFVCCNDMVAASLVKHLEVLGLRVPQDLLVGGFDDVSIARLMTPSLTTVAQPCAEIARTAFARLRQRVQNPAFPPLDILLPAPLRVRLSTERRQ